MNEKLLSTRRLLTIALLLNTIAWFIPDVTHFVQNYPFAQIHIYHSPLRHSDWLLDLHECQMTSRATVTLEII